MNNVPGLVRKSDVYTHPDGQKLCHGFKYNKYTLRHISNNNLCVSSSGRTLLLLVVKGILYDLYYLFLTSELV